MIQSSIFNLENDGDIDFSINRKPCVQEPVKDSVFSRRDFNFIKPQSRINMRGFQYGFNKAYSKYL